MKSLIRKIASTRLGVTLRSLIGFHPAYIHQPNEDRGVSVSDAFPWRTDNGFKTVFKYADILRLFYKLEGSSVEFAFYTSDNLLIKKTLIGQLNYSNELVIDKKYLDGVEGYGVFYIFHRSDSDQNGELIISNRCYVGFSLGDTLASFVHGNTYSKYQTLDGKIEASGMMLSTFFTKPYRIQNTFTKFDKSELFLTNSTSRSLNFSIGDSAYSMEKGCSVLVDVSGKDNITILSRCLLLRPVIFNYKDSFIDVYHG